MSTVPNDFEVENTGGGIALSAGSEELFVSSRGHGSVVRFAIDFEHQALHTPSWVSVQGQVPRFIVLDPFEQTLLVANEDADSIVRLDKSTSQSSKTAHTGSPVCIAFS